MPLKIRVSNLNKKRRIDRSSARGAASHVLKRFGVGEALVDITFISDRRIRALNRKYMGRDNPTDVLSFSLAEGARVRRKSLIGDIYISSDTAYSNAKRFGTNFRKELLLYIVHGMLHLVGFGDRTAREKGRIRRLEGRFLKELWYRE